MPTIYQFDVELADHDRSVFETLHLRVARHPSESEDYLVARVLAYALEYEEGIEFSKGGLSSPDEPAIAVRDLTGACRRWIEIGTPEPERLHRAAKTGAAVAVYAHRDPGKWLERLSREQIHKADAMSLWALDRPLIAELVSRLDRRVEVGLSVSDRELFVSSGREMLSGAIRPLSLSH